MIVQRLRQIQEQHGFLPDAELFKLAQDVSVPLYRIQEVASFFPHFRQEWNKPPFLEVKVCRDMSCHGAGAVKLFESLKLLERGGEQLIVIEYVSCLGRCDRAPAVCISRYDHNAKEENRTPKESLAFHDFIYAGRKLDKLHGIVMELAEGKDPPAPDLDAQYRVDRSSWQIDVYKKKEFEPYAAVKALLNEPAPLNEPHPKLKRLEVSGLLGMGGAGVPAYRKWLDVWQARPAGGSKEKYIVCNGDESEPATFKDREILLHMPHLVIEGVVLAGLITQATAGYIFIRHEYTEQIEAVQAAIQKAELLGACGRNIFDSGRDFPVEVFISPGGYICGEQSALLEAMEDRRAQPRNRPPELSTNGLRDRPTVVNNVETLAWTPAIMLRGGEWYAREGAAGYKGRRLFSVCGDLVQPGVFEVAIGATLGALIELAGGVRGGGLPKAICTSGPSGGFFPPAVPLPQEWQTNLEKELSEVDRGNQERMKKLFATLLPPGATKLNLLMAPLDKGVFGILASVLEAPLMLGAGLAVFAEPTDVLDQAVRATEFFRNESCGKCVPCRIGSEKLVNIGTELLQRRNEKRLPSTAVADCRVDVADLSRVMGVTSICGLGQVAYNPMYTALQYFAEDAAARPPRKGGTDNA